MKKALIILSIIIISISCSTNHENEEFIITKNGFKDYILGETKLNKIVQDFGTNYEVIDNEWIYEISYKDLGLSFSFGSGNLLVATEFFYPFNGKTDKGIILNLSTMKDVKLAYDSLDWYISSPWIEWCSEYPGIEFCVNRDTSLTMYPLNERLHEMKRIERIIVLDNDIGF